MHDLNTFRNHLQDIRDRLATRGYSLDIAAFEELDARRRQLLTESERIKAERNQASAEIGKLRKAGEDTAERQEQVRALGSRISELDAEAETLDAGFRDF